MDIELRETECISTLGKFPKCNVKDIYIEIDELRLNALELYDNCKKIENRNSLVLLLDTEGRYTLEYDLHTSSKFIFPVFIIRDKVKKKTMEIKALDTRKDLLALEIPCTCNIKLITPYETIELTQEKCIDTLEKHELLYNIDSDNPDIFNSMYKINNVMISQIYLYETENIVCSAFGNSKILEEYRKDFYARYMLEINR